VPHLLRHLREVQARLGLAPAAGADVPLSEAVDSMGLVEFLAAVAADWGVGPQALEKAARGRFGPVAAPAGALPAARLGPRPTQAAQPGPAPPSPRSGGAWLAAAASRLPAAIQPAGALDALLGKPADWLEAHAGIRGRRAWGDEDA